MSDPAPRANASLLMSIRPKYAELIFDGLKTIELRRRRPKVKRGDLVLVYVSSPTKALLGAFEVKEIVSLRPALLWEFVGNKSGVSRAVFDEYFRGREIGHGIVVAKAWRLPVKVSLASLREITKNFHPPQSYRYLSKDFPFQSALHKRLPKTGKRKAATRMKHVAAIG